MKYFLQIFLFVSFVHSVSFARPTITISNSSDEVTYAYETEFRSLELASSNKTLDAEALANFHAIHLYGIFQSADYVTQYGLDVDMFEGFAGTHYPEVVSAKIIKKQNDRYLWVQYRAEGKMLVIKPVLADWIGNKKSGKVKLPLLADLSLVYLDDLSDYRDKSVKNCTDSHYLETSNFSYFYTPFLCPALRTPPIAQDVEIDITRVDNTGADTKLVPLQEIRSDNGNGKLTVLYFIYGFDGSLDSSSNIEQIKRDSAWKLYRSLHKNLETHYGFQNMGSTAELKSELGDDFKSLELSTPVTMTHNTQRRYFSTHVKHVGDQILVVRSALFDTSNEVSSAPLLSFPKFWKEAWENGDFIYYGGHSEDGASLSITGILNNLRTQDTHGIHFSKNKTQIAFIDACSSYAHFLDMYNELKPDNLYFITYGVVSLFHLAEATVETSLEILINQPAPLTWENALKEIEMDQLVPHIEFYYGIKAAPSIIKKHQRKNEYPQMMLNVSVPK